MARKIRTEEETTEGTSPYQTSTMSVEPAEESVPLVDPSPMKGNAAAREPAREIEVPPTKRYRVMNQGYFTIRGHRALLRPGKVVDAHNYDLDSLRSQGVVLEEIS